MILNKEQYYIFDPTQFKEFGYEFFSQGDFYYRYQLSKKFFLKNIYIPYGPNCKTKASFENFLEHINSFRFTTITIDLPMVYDNHAVKDITQQLVNHGFTKVPYLHQDEETIIILKNNFKSNSKRMNKVRHGYKFTNIVVKNELNSEEIDQIYEIYLLSATRIGFSPKSKDVFRKLSESCLVSIAYNKLNNKPEGYVFGYIMETNQTITTDSKVKVLLIMFTSLTDDARKHRLGYALHYDLFNTAFKIYHIDMIDFHGASRKKSRSYVAFKQDWGGKFYSLPGCFKKRLR